jgi:hypothetical protein
MGIPAGQIGSRRLDRDRGGEHAIPGCGLRGMNGTSQRLHPNVNETGQDQEGCLTGLFAAPLLNFDGPALSVVVDTEMQI